MTHLDECDRHLLVHTLTLTALVHAAVTQCDAVVHSDRRVYVDVLCKTRCICLFQMQLILTAIFARVRVGMDLWLSIWWRTGESIGCTQMQVQSCHPCFLS